MISELLVLRNDADGIATLTPIFGNSRRGRTKTKEPAHETGGLARDAVLTHERMRNTGFDPAMRKRGELIGAARRPG